ncbi:EAL domain-containing protein [Wenzhouxiangella sp. XN24]|uniref:EAL domain-containing protein n=1 Tax=Wenzhouxiangella sp. XN24 TaxID=2713569 RepID=UPI0013EC7FF9|nr:EAL domain-containing protein [Wenzhouxiangella sp. XN24]NGX17323.1 EAL domain-containing protein [Wenzhouxiangella sp. XN24]
MRILPWLIIGFLAAPFTSYADQTLNIGVFAYRDKAMLETRLTPVARYLGEALPRYDIRLLVLDQREIEAALLRHELDFLFTNPTHYITLREHNALSGAVATLVNLESGVPVAALGGVVVARAGRSDVVDLASLQGKTVAITGRRYLGGYAAPMEALREAGIDPRRLDFVELGQPHDNVVRAVLEGEVDAGFIRTGIIEHMISEGRLEADALQVVARQDLPGFPFAVSTRLYPEWPFVALPHVDPQTARRLTAALLALEPGDPAAVAAGIHGFAVPADYAPVERAMRALGLPPFDMAPSIRLGDVWSTFRLQITVLAVAIVLVLVLSGALAVANRRIASARRETEHSARLLEREHSQLQTLLNSLPQVVWLRDVDGVHLGCNRRFEQLIGWPEHAVIGRTTGELGASHLATLDRDVPAGRTVMEAVVRFADDGHEELLEITQTPVLDTTGRVIGVLGVGQDITERTRQRNELVSQRRRLDTIIKGTRVGTWEWNVQTGELVINERWAEMIGYTLAELQPITITTWNRFVHPDDFARSSRVLGRHFCGEVDHYECELRMRHKAGHWVWVLDRGAIASRSEDGKPLLVAGTHQDISARKRADEQRLEVLDRLQNIAAHVPGVIYQYRLRPDGSSHFPYASAGMSAIYGLTPEAVAEDATPVFEVLHPEDRARVAERILESARRLAPWFDQYRVCLPDGRTIWLEGSAAPVPQEDQSIIWHGHIRDITRLKAHEQELRQIAHYDTLTGTPNRRLLMELLQKAVAHARRAGRHLAVCYLDVDGFKAVNDRLGHASGDRLLVELTARLKTVLRGEDTLARLGGDEFVLLLNDLEGVREAEAVLQRVLAKAGEPIVIAGRKLAVTSSIGLTMFPPDDPEPDTLLRHADQAMYRAKSLGRNRCHVFDPDQDRLSMARRKSLDRLERALEEGEFALYYQPKVNLEDGAVVGMEALLRWRHPSRGVLSPGTFLGQLDGTELEIRLGDWVVERALEQIGRWNEAGMAQVVSVNISPTHLLVPDFAERIEQALSRHPQVAPEQLELEIVENATLSNLEEASLLLASCRNLGVRVSLDDFGTGYSSLAYLRRLPVDLLKIDQSFVRDMLHDPNDLGIVESVVRLARAFNRPVIAEGVETMEHGAMLLRLGCPLAQGYGIGMPMPAEELPQWLEDWRERGAWRSLSDGLAPGREALFLEVVTRSHTTWAADVIRCIESGVTASVPGDGACQFGQWYHGIGTADFGLTAEFQALGALHTQVHAMADQLLALCDAGQAEVAQARLGEFHGARARLLAGIAALREKACGNDVSNASQVENPDAPVIYPSQDDARGTHTRMHERVAER